MGIEQRQYARLGQEFSVNYEVVPIGLPRPLPKPVNKGWVKNISGGGLNIIVSGISNKIMEKLSSHSLALSLEFHLPDFQNRVKALANVQWSSGLNKWWQIWAKRQWSLGIRFTYIEPEDKNCIIKYVINKHIESRLMKSASN